MFRIVAISAAAFIGLAQALTVNTPPSLVQCQPALLSWGQGTAPYYLAIIPGGQPSAAALENLPTQQGTTYTWTVDIAAGQTITVKITDSTGAVNYSDQVTVQAGTSSTCGASSGGAAAAGSSGAAPAGSSSPAAAVASNTAASFSPSSSMNTVVKSSATSAPTTSGIAANANAQTTSTTSGKNGASSIKAASGLLLGGLVLALAA